MKNQTAVTTTIHQLEEKLLQPNVRKSEKELSALLADEFIEYRSSGSIADKNQTVRGVLTEKPTQVTLSNFKANILATDVVLATYLAVKQDSDGIKIYSLRSSIWKMINNRWQLVFHQGTPAKS